MLIVVGYDVEPESRLSSLVRTDMSDATVCGEYCKVLFVQFNRCSSFKAFDTWRNLIAR